MITATSIVAFNADHRQFCYGPQKAVLTPDDHWLARIELLDVVDPGPEMALLLPGKFLKGPHTDETFLYFAGSLVSHQLIGKLYHTVADRWRAYSPAWPIISLRVASYYVHSYGMNVHRPRFEIVDWRPIPRGGGPRKRHPRPVAPALLEAA